MIELYMEKSQEMIKYLDKFILDQSLKYPHEGTFEYGKMCEAMSKMVFFERPDGYSILNNTIYIFEHFEIDSTKHNKKGSQNKIEEFKDEQKFQQAVKKSNDEMVIYNGQLEIEPKAEFYKENLIKTFQNHYQKIDEYKQHINMQGININDYKMQVVFVIEDSSTFGTLYFDKGIRLVLPIFTKDFNEIFEKAYVLDAVVCSSETSNNEVVTWSVARNDLSLVRDVEVSLDDIELIDFNPMTIRGSFFIPFNN